MKKSHKRSIQKRSDVAPLKNEVFVNIGFPHDMTISGTMNVEELARQLDCSSKIATENWKSDHNFMAEEKMPAILAYNGQAYKHLRASSLSDVSLEYAQKHLWITCFLYGLLRPMDGIVPYRMEHCVSLANLH